jgi:hypothetical protein
MVAVGSWRGWHAATDSAELVLVDQRFAALRERYAVAGELLLFTGDVTPLWRDRLAPLWKQRGAVIAGLSTAPALFCLEQLARGTRHVVTRRALAVSPEHAPESKHGAIAWTIAPVA